MGTATQTEPRHGTRGGTVGATTLSGLLFDGEYEETHRDIRAVLFDPAFDPREGLTSVEAGKLTYTRSRVLHRDLERPRDMLRRPRRLFALAEWAPLLDPAVFSVLLVHHNLALGTVLDLGAGRDDIEDHVEELDRLDSFGPYMATELGYGNNVAALRTEAVYDPETESFVLDTPDAGAQKFMSATGFTDLPKLAVVLARLKADGRNHGVHAFLVRISDGTGPAEGVHITPAPEQPVQGVDHALTRFDRVVVPRRNLLYGEKGGFSPDGSFLPGGGNLRRRFLHTMSRIQPGRLCVASAAVGAGKASVYTALRYAETRLTNGPGRGSVPVLDYRSHQRDLFPALAKVYAMNLLLNHAKREFEAHPGPASDELNHLISLTKALSTWEMSEVAGICRERCGAQGGFRVNRIAEYGSLLHGLVTAEGDNQVLLATTAGQLLTGEDRPLAAGPAKAADDVEDPRVQLALLRRREDSLHRKARADMAASEGTYFDAWNGAVNTALDMARTRGVRLALEQLAAAVPALADERDRTALGLLASLYGLVEIRRDAGWYLAGGLVTGAAVEGLSAAVDGLCERLRPHARRLTEAFRLTPELLRAPLAYDDPEAAFLLRTGASGPTGRSGAAGPATTPPPRTPGK
ncbi:acyl-CoA dehydrogenase [Streptomyces flavochromogenes]|uniref:acyl-CoA dehydrogenase family protein n=1 Tax=Streptomyces flavochromogenes TaxID=68199 RepID=UPI0007C5196A|nr:acyl-CoA dehydrogenase [Streptomyces flavochromogenes]